MPQEGNRIREYGKKITINEEQNSQNGRGIRKRELGFVNAYRWVYEVMRKFEGKISHKHSTQPSDGSSDQGCHFYVGSNSKKYGCMLRKALADEKTW